VAGSPDYAELQTGLNAAYEQEAPVLDVFEVAADLRPGERANIRVVRECVSRGVEFCVGRVNAETGASRLQLVNEFVRFGAKAVLLTGSQRGGDFLMNQLFGQWAERTVVSMHVPGIVLRPFGPSSAAMPGEADHRQTVMTFRQIVLVEGKRPDLIAFDEDVWTTFTSSERRLIDDWPERLLTPDDDDLVRRALFGAEVKISKWHYGKRRDAGGGPLSVTVKDEERESIEAWQRGTGVPVLFFQALLDEIYCMSFRRMQKAIKAGYLYEPGDVESGTQQGAGGKKWHRFHVDGEPHRCGLAKFPSESGGEVRVLESGAVVAFVSFAPARGTCSDPNVIYNELAYATRSV
jgi:hypothetical protein